MNTLLIFFALPIATIIISIALQRVLKCPALVAGIIFAIFLIVTFIINNLNFLVATIVYTIISFLTALIFCIICRFLNNEEDDDSCCSCGCCNNQENNNENTQSQLLISSNNYNGTGENSFLTTNSTSYNNSGTYNCNTIDSNGVTTRVNVIPNNYNSRMATPSYKNNRRRVTG